VSWQLAAVLLVCLALGAGFVWYERTRPSSRVLALVGTLAALAALGRLAFAPLPDVKPTTAIVVISGYALGGAPGFAIGAVAALSSNMFYGQGPWTPWQMLGWGLAGVIGALLARAGGRSLGRWPLALACGLAAIVFNLLADLSIWVTYSGDLSWSRFLLIETAGLWFNVTHVVASIVFFLIFGPTLITILERFRTRLDVQWTRPAGAAPLAIAIVALAVGVAAARPQPARASAGAGARTASLAPELRYLRSAQRADGGFGGDPRGSSSELFTAWATLGIAAAGDDPGALRRGGRSPVDFIRMDVRDVNGAGDVERTILALESAGVSARRVGARDLVAELLRDQQPNGSFAGQVNLTAFAIFALRAAGMSRSAAVVSRAHAWLSREQNGDGSFNFATRGAPGDVDDTAAALQALVAGGARGAAVTRAARFLAGEQNLDGGFPLSPGDDSNAQSTAWAVQGFVAAGRDPSRISRRGSTDPLSYLRSLVAPDGSVRYSRTSSQTPVWVTAQALTALARKPFPLTGRPRARRAGARARAAASSARRTSSRQRRAPRNTAAHSRATAASTADPAAAPRLRRWAREAGALAGLLADIGTPPPAGIG
jgi:energy-coupling factor transport system substrate-specific component